MGQTQTAGHFRFPQTTGRVRLFQKSVSTPMKKSGKILDPRIGYQEIFDFASGEAPEYRLNNYLIYGRQRGNRVKSPQFPLAMSPMRSYVPDTLPLPGLDFRRLFRRAADANAEVARFDGLLKGINNAELLLSPLTTNEAVLSSRIEGTQATLDDVLQYEAGTKKPAVLVEDIKEIINYRQAIYYSRRYLESRPISLAFLRELHQILMTGVRGTEKTPGSFRQTQNYIGKPGDTLENAIFAPPNPIRLTSDLEDFQAYLSGNDIEVLVQTAIVHVQFELIHPFNDGNGRIGRLLIPLFLYQKNKLSQPVFYISGYLEQHRETYYARLREISSPAKDWNGWIEFFLDAVTTEAVNNCEKVQNIITLYEELKEKIPQITRSQHSIRVQDAIFNRPIFQSNDFIKDVGINPSSAKRFLRQLRDADIVRELLPKKGANPASLIFWRLINITEGRKIFSERTELENNLSITDSTFVVHK